jgi:hypothetical protein
MHEYEKIGSEKYVVVSLVLVDDTTVASIADADGIIGLGRFLNTAAGVKTSFFVILKLFNLCIFAGLIFAL